MLCPVAIQYNPLPIPENSKYYEEWDELLQEKFFDKNIYFPDQGDSETLSGFH